MKHVLYTTYKGVTALRRKEIDKLLENIKTRVKVHVVDFPFCIRERLIKKALFS